MRTVGVEMTNLLNTNREGMASEMETGNNTGVDYFTKKGKDFEAWLNKLTSEKNEFLNSVELFKAKGNKKMMQTYCSHAIALANQIQASIGAARILGFQVVHHCMTNKYEVIVPM